MTIAGVLIGLALVVLMAPLILRPLIDGRPSDDGAVPEPQGPRLEAVLAALRDLDFDFQTGKVIESDYAPARAALLARAAEAMTRRPGLNAAVEPLEPALEERVARMRLELERHRPAKQCPACAARVLPGDQFCVRCGEALARACPTCGAPMGERDRFCAACGRELAPAARALWPTGG